MKGKIICIDGGGDRIGKHTQATLLSEYLQKLGLAVKCISFPNYGTPQAKPVEDYLNGNFSCLKPLEVSMLYALDRSVTLREEMIPEFLQNGGCVIFDRYVSSNVVYQTAISMKHSGKSITGDFANTALIMRIEQLEYEILKLPRPDLTIYLDMSRYVNEKLLMQDLKNDDKTGDLIEQDRELLDRVNVIGKELALLCNWKIVTCDDGISPYPKELIHEKVVRIVEEFAEELPTQKEE